MDGGGGGEGCSYAAYLISDMQLGDCRSFFCSSTACFYRLNGVQSVAIHAEQLHASLDTQISGFHGTVLKILKRRDT